MRRPRSIDAPEIQIAPMIDCVFLMLVYFMTTSSLEKSEADLPCPVGSAGVVSDPLPAVDEQSLAISGDGKVNWNGSIFDLNDPAGSGGLISRLIAFKETCGLSESEPSLRLVPDEATSHQSIVILLDSITMSGIETIHFP
jgi:biopolymer transport protein ExbD